MTEPSPPVEERCERCNGTGYVETSSLWHSDAFDCASCKGTGKRPSPPLMAHPMSAGEAVVDEPKVPWPYRPVEERCECGHEASEHFPATPTRGDVPGTLATCSTCLEKAMFDRDTEKAAALFEQCRHPYRPSPLVEERCTYEWDIRGAIIVCEGGPDAPVHSHRNGHPYRPSPPAQVPDLRVETHDVLFAGIEGLRHAAFTEREEGLAAYWHAMIDDVSNAGYDTGRADERAARFIGGGHPEEHQPDQPDAVTAAREWYNTYPFGLAGSALVEGAFLAGVQWRRADERAAADDLRVQVQRLATFIMKNIPGEPSQSQGAIDTAIRLLGERAAAEATIAELRAALEDVVKYT